MKLNWDSFFLGVIASCMLMLMFGFYLFVLRDPSSDESIESSGPVYGKLNLIPDKDAYFSKIEKICIEKGLLDSIKSERKLVGATYKIDSIEVIYRCDSRKYVDISYSRVVNDSLFIKKISLNTENDRYDYGDEAFFTIYTPGERLFKREMTQTEIYAMLNRIK